MANEETVKKVSRIKDIKKNWYKLISPRIFGQREMGETYLPNAEKAIGRQMNISLKELTGNVKDQNAYAHFKIIGAQGGKLDTQLLGYSLTTNYIRRVVKKSIERIDNYYVLKSNEGEVVIIKTLMITLRKTKRSICSKLGLLLGQELKAELSKSNFINFVNNVIYQKVQIPLKKKLSKVYPLRELGIRYIFLKQGDVSQVLKHLERAQNKEVVLEQPEEEAATENSENSETSENNEPLQADAEN